MTWNYTFYLLSKSQYIGIHLELFSCEYGLILMPNPKPLTRSPSQRLAESDVIDYYHLGLFEITSQ